MVLVDGFLFVVLPPYIQTYSDCICTVSRNKPMSLQQVMTQTFEIPGCVKFELQVLRVCSATCKLLVPLIDLIHDAKFELE